MREIIPNVHLLEGLRSGNVYLLVSDGRLALIDAGMAWDADRLIAQIEEEGYDPSQLKTLILTHAHPDHVGGASKLADRFPIQVAAHREEVPYIEGRKSLPARHALQALMHWIGGLTPTAESGVRVTRGLEDGQTLDILGGLQVLHTPGHTPGSLCLYQQEMRVMFSGDLLMHGHPLTGRGGLRCGPRLFTVAPDQMERSARRVAQLNVEVLCVGHGEPIVENAGIEIEALLEGLSA